MSTRSKDDMKRKFNVILVMALGLTACFCAFGQEPVPVSKSYVVWAQDFLRTMYPALNGKGYVFTVKTGLPYDNPGAPILPQHVFLGEGPEYAVLYVVGGPVDFPRPAGDFPAGPRAQQVLQTGFDFDGHDRLLSFSAEGSAIGNREAAMAFAKLVENHPEMTDAEVIAALKKAGAKYGPNDKESLIKDFPYAKLDRFLGKLRVVSVDFFPLDERRDNPESWPMWTVMAEAKQRDGTVITYKLTFEPFKGDLLDIGSGNRVFSGEW
jgi:hypothetical protein